MPIPSAASKDRNSPRPDTADNGSVLLPQHQADLRRSGLSADTIAAAGFISVTDPQQVRRLLGWQGGGHDLGACLLVPFRSADGTPIPPEVFCRLKPDRPLTSSSNGRARKYESPRGKGLRAYFPPGSINALADPAVALLVVEGEKKSLKASQEGFPC